MDGTLPRSVILVSLAISSSILEILLIMHVTHLYDASVLVFVMTLS